MLILEERRLTRELLGKTLLRKPSMMKSGYAPLLFSIKIVLINHGFMGFRGITYANLGSNNSRNHIQERTI